MKTIEESVYDNGHFYMPVSDIFKIQGRGYVFVGYIESGTINKGDEVLLSNGQKSRVGAIDFERKLLEKATKGDSVGLLLSDIKEEMIKDTAHLIIEKEDGIAYTPEPEIEQDKGHFVMPVAQPEDENIFYISGKGVLLIGCIESGTVHVGDTVILSNGKKSFVENIQMAGDNGKTESVNWATKGEGCGLNLGSITKNDLPEVKGLVVEGIDNPNNDFEMTVSGKESVKGKGVVIIGKVDSGTISVGDPVIISKYENGGIMKSASVTTIEINGYPSETASAGQTASIGFKSLTARNNVDKTITTKVSTAE